MLILLFGLLFLSVSYGIIYVVNQTGNFTIELDPNLKAKKNIVMSSSKDFKSTPLTLKSNSIEYFDNISEAWLPIDIDANYEGEHSGNNYIAYTFFVKNRGDIVTAYSMNIQILSVVKNVDEAVRVALYTNGEKVVYAKRNKTTNEPEEGTEAFLTDEQIMYSLRENMEPKDIDKYTIVIWLEGDDPDCIDAIIGGELKMNLYLGEDRK